MSKSRFMEDAVTPFAITLMSGFPLGGVYQLTKRPIELATIATNDKAYKAVFVEAKTFDSDEALTAAIPVCNEALTDIDFGGMEVRDVLRAVDVGGSQLDHAITSPSNNNYGGVVELPVGLKSDRTITGTEFLEISDAPGLGSRAKESAFRDQHAGKNAPELSVIESGSVDDIQVNVVGGATITPSTTTNAVNAALYYLHSCVQ